MKCYLGPEVLGTARACSVVPGPGHAVLGISWALNMQGMQPTPGSAFPVIKTVPPGMGSWPCMETELGGVGEPAG